MTLALNHAIGAYRNANRAVAPTKAVALLLDEVLNAIILTSYFLRRKEYESAFSRVVHASKVMSGLRQAVKLDSNPEMGQQFIEMYSKNIIALHNAYGREDAVEQYAQIAKGLLALRNAWAELARLPERNIDTVMEEILDQKPTRASANPA